MDFIPEPSVPVTNDPIRGTKKPLIAAMNVDQKAAQHDHPQMAEMARQEGFPLVAGWLENLVQAEG